MFNSEKRILIASLIVAILLTVLKYPIPLLKPYWVALVVIYWVLESNHLQRLGTVFVLGLVLDVVAATLFGQHAISLLIMVYLLQLFRQRMRFFPPWQLTAAVFLLLLNDRILQLWVLWLSGHLPSWEYWINPFIGAALWPWVFLALDSLRSNVRRRAQREARS